MGSAARSALSATKAERRFRYSHAENVRPREVARTAEFQSPPKSKLET
jgi:hypothetical protein